MEHRIHRIISVQPVGPATISVVFTDGLQRVIDLTPVLRGPYYGPLRDPGLFGQVRVDPETHTVVWPNGADFEPSILHDWPELVGELAERASTWPEPSADRPRSFVGTGR